MQFKTTNKLFKGIYQYKAVLIVPGAAFFRAGDLDSALKNLNRISNEVDKTSNLNLAKRYSIKSNEDLTYAISLHDHLKKLKDFEIRVESPFVSIYTNSNKDIEELTCLDEDRVKYVSKPPNNSSLISGTVLLPKINFDYRVTLGKTTQEHSAFVEWATFNKKLKLTKSCTNDLVKSRSWGGTYFYVSGDNNLLMAKMHLGGSINKVERIIKV
jgi:hypothetical protein